jgi:cyclophilin family peptidyl-prolyl cis-trans isomerase
MMKKFALLLFAIGTLTITADAQSKTVKKTAKPAPKTAKAAVPAAKKKITQEQKNNFMVKMTTDSGVIVLKLSDSTPLHRDNFVKLVKQNFFDSLLFHRVIPQFMIQGGDPTSKNAPAGNQLGNGGDDMARIPAEFHPSLYHKKGALAAARDGNPEKASSACQFYIVEGKTFTDAELDMMEARIGRKYTAAERNTYKTVGGTPFLDNNYTVFGEVISGQEVIHKIATAARDANDRPLGDVKMKVEMVKP